MKALSMGTTRVVLGMGVEIFLVERNKESRSASRYKYKKPRKATKVAATNCFDFFFIDRYGFPLFPWTMEVTPRVLSFRKTQRRD